MARPLSPLQRFAVWIEDKWLEAGLILIPFLITVGTLFQTEDILKRLGPRLRAELPIWGGPMVWGGILLFVPIVILAFRRIKRISQLEEQLTRCQAELLSWAESIEATTFGTLAILARGLEFGTKGKNTERISVYAHDSAGYFVPCARFSYNAEYIKRGREFFPDNQGAIGEAWRHNTVWRVYPDPKTSVTDYVAQCARERIPEHVSRALKMKSRVVFGWKIMDVRKERGLAVVILESVDPNRYNEADVREFFGKNEEMLSTLFERLAPMFPRISKAKEAGF